LNTLETLSDWIGLLSSQSLALGLMLSVVIVGIGLWPSAPRRLEPRLRALIENRTTAGRGPGGILVRLRQVMQLLGTTAILQALGQKLGDLGWGTSLMGRKKQAVLRQAGLRGARAYLYFEAMRVVLSIGFGLMVFLMVKTTGVARNNTVQTSVLVLGGLILGAYLPDLYVKRRIARRRAEFDANWDDAIGLLIICLEAGLSVEVALRRIARELAASAPILAEELIITLIDLSLLTERRQAYLNLAKRIDLPSVQSVTIALVQAEKQGASISNSLRIIAQANREERLSRAETKAAALGPKMTVPMLLFFLPVIFIVIIAPIVLTADLNL
jgi:tight adherence protein C